MSETYDPDDWWKLTVEDLVEAGVDAERDRATAILAACLKAGRPTLAIRWIATGASLDEVIDILISMLVFEKEPDIDRPPTTPSGEFNEGVHIFVGHNISRTQYCEWRRRERN